VGREPLVKRVFAWLTDTAGCFHYRIKTPLDELNTLANWDVSWGAPGPDIHDYDVVVGQRIAGHSPTWEALCTDPNVLAVYDIDDDLLNIDPANTVPYSIYAPIRDATQRNIARADLVTAATPKLAEYLQSINPRTVVLPNCVPNHLPYGGQQWSADRFTVGWAGSMFHHQDWSHMPAKLAEFWRVFPRAEFHMIGADYTGGAVPTRVSGWGTVESYYSRLDFNVGVAPIVITPFNERKSWIKLLEYAAHGIPAVATNAGQYPEWIEHGVNGFLVNHESEWVDFLLALTDRTLHASASAAALAKAREFTIEKQIHRWVNAYTGEAK
jgi:glycosyltransferase involved in cell wall biosynthesis